MALYSRLWNGRIVKCACRALSGFFKPFSTVMQHFRKILISGIVWKLLFYLSAFFLNILLASRLGASESGNLFYVLNNVSIAILVLTFGIESSINYFHAKNEFGFTYLLSVAVLWSSFGAVLSALVLYVLTQLRFIDPNAHAAYIILYIFGSLLTISISSLYYSSNKHLLPNLLPSAANLFLILYLLMGFKNKPLITNSILPAYLIAGGITGIIFFLLATGRSRPSSLKHLSIFNKKLFAYSAQVFFANIFFTLLLRSDIWLVKALSSRSDLGNYIQTTKFSQLILLVPNLASFALFPLITQSVANKFEIENKLLRIINLYFYCGLLLCLFIAVTGHWLFPYLYGPTFSKMHGTFIAYIPGLLFLVSSYPLTPFFSSINSNKTLIMAAFSSLLIMIGLDLLLIPYLSAYGAALGSSIAYGCYFTWLLLAFKKRSPSGIKRIFRLREFLNNTQSIIQSRSL
jgi:O-antigen/teichoic acid export membrane protein